MSTALVVYNTLTRKKETFTPIQPGKIGMYLCGPTVYGYPHLGHARSAIAFDIVFRYLQFLDYKVRYVRNITDVGHLLNDADEGEDKIGKIALQNDLEPMEVAQYYTNSYHHYLDMLNVLRPSIEPRASGHIIEQIHDIESIIAAGFAYESNGSVYFDVPAYSAKHHYGILSGRVLEDLMAGAGEERRSLEGQSEKRNPADFALWKKASPEHIMRWPSPWSSGFPGWHIECTAMSTKYLGKEFDIHAGGMDLLFPHHECEIAQCQAAHGSPQARYWLHNNMITVNGQKMGKSLGNAIGLEEFFTGNHPLLAQAYSPQVIRFFMLQAHYRSTLDFSNEALQAAEKGLNKLLQAIELIDTLKPSATDSFEVEAYNTRFNTAMNDDFNTPILIAELFDAVGMINKMAIGQATLTAASLQLFAQLIKNYTQTVMGIQAVATTDSHDVDGLLQIIINQRNHAKARKDYPASDAIRNELLATGYQLKDSKEGTAWQKI